MQGTPHHPVQLGDTGEEVRFLQDQLKGTSYFDGDVDGQFGYETEAAVKAFQSDRGLPATGVCDAETWATIDPISVMPNPTADVHISDGPHMQGNWITVGATVRSGSFDVGQIVTNCWVQTDDGGDPRSVWETQAQNDEPLEAGGAVTYGWAVENLEPGQKYLACLTVNINDITDSVQEENNWMLGFTWDGENPVNPQRYR